MLDPRRLVLLATVARHGSLTAAAAKLGYSPSALSQQVAALEREAGTTLLERNARGVRLTEAGAALVTHADAILARIEDAEDELAAIAGLREQERAARDVRAVERRQAAQVVVVGRRRDPDDDGALAGGDDRGLRHGWIVTAGRHEHK